jgi:tetratricopeptide (TPR) repeat protein
MPADRTLWEIRRELAECLIAAEQPDEALKFIQGELASAEDQPGTRRMDAVDKLDAIELKGQALMRLGRPQEAEAVFREGVRLAKSGKEPRLAWAAWFETQIALVRVEEGELSEAEKMLGNSSETLLRIKGAEHEWTKAAAEALQNVRAKQDAARESAESARQESR